MQKHLHDFVVKNHAPKEEGYLDEGPSQLNKYVYNSLSKFHIGGEMIHQHLIPTENPNIVYNPSMPFMIFSIFLHGYWFARFGLPI